MNIKNIVCFVAGTSGGHIIPALTLAQKYKEKNYNTKVLFFSTNTELDKQIIKNKITWYKPLTLNKIPYKKPYLWPQFIFHFLKSFFIALYLLKKKSPSKVISTGGYIALPVCFAAKLLSIPIELFELNVLPGKTTSFLAPFAKKINICFKETKKFLQKYNCHYTKYPISFKKNNLKTERLPKHFCSKKNTIFILGGSQGSLFINNTIKKWINIKSDNSNIQIVHQTGNNDKTNWNTFYKKHNIPAIIFPFSKNIEQYYKISDLIICRSGAGTLFEVKFFNKKCITIPLETKMNNHQVENAKSFMKNYKKLDYILQKTIINDPTFFIHCIQNKIANKP